MPHTFLQDLLVVFGLGLVAVVVFHKLRLPAVLGFLVTGVICGPYGFKFVDDVKQLDVLAEVGVVLLLFSLGIEFSIPHFMRMRRFLLIGGALQVGGTLAAAAGLAHIFGMPLSLAVFIGMLVSVSSTALVLRVLEGRRELDAAHGRNALTILIFQDLCIVPMVLMTPFLGGQEVHLADLALIGGKALVFLVGTFTVVRYCLPWILNHVAQTQKREAFILTIIFLSLGMAAATAHVGLSMALGAFVAGLVLSESKFSHQALGEIVPFRELFNCIVFVSIGMMFDVHTLLSMPVFIASCLILVIGLKTLVAAVATRVMGHSFKVAVLTGLALSQASEFSFVLGKVGLANGVIDAHTNQVFLAVAILSMMFTPALCGLGPSLFDWIGRRVPWLASQLGTNSSSAVPSDEATKDHVIISGYGVKGQELAKVLDKMGIKYVVVDSDPVAVRKGRKQGLTFLYGDATNQQVLMHAGIARARVLALTQADGNSARQASELAHRLNRDIHIIARARELPDLEALVKAGAHEVVAEEFVSAVEILTRVLQRYYVADETVDTLIQAAKADWLKYSVALHQSFRPGHGLQHVPSHLEMSVFRAEPGSAVDGKSLVECGLRTKTGATVVAIQAKNGTETLNPRSYDVINAGDAVIVLGRQDQLAEAALFFKAAQS